MAVPKQRHTKSRRNKRRAHIHLEKPSLGVCPKCQKPILPHAVCKNCGYYKGREIIDVMKKLDKKERKKKEMETKEEGKKEEKPLTWQDMSKK